MSIVTAAVSVRTAAACLATLVLGALSAAASAQAYPSKPIRLITGSPGGATDVRARWLAERLRPALGQPIVVDNRGSAGGTIGTEAAAKSTPDGYTVVLVHQGTIAIAPYIYARLGYDPIADLAPVTRLSMNPLLLAANPQVPSSSVADLLRYARENPGKLSYGSPGSGTPPHLAAELFKSMAKIEAVHVPYKGGQAALMDLIGGRVAYTFENLALQWPQVKTGKIKAVAITSARRLASLPDVPTVAESGLPGYEYSAWMGISTPAKTPREIVFRLNTEIARILKTHEAREWLATQGAEPGGDSPEEFAAFIKAERAKWGPIIREAGIKPD